MEGLVIGVPLSRADWGAVDPMAEKDVADFEALCIAQYRYAGMARPDELITRDMAHQPFRQQRLEGRVTEDGVVYPLEMEDHVQGCEFITTRALAAVEDPLMRRFATAHLWRFASRQLPDGRFPSEAYGTGFGLIGILDAVARHDHPAAQVIILRALPWIVDAQRADGGWAQAREKREDAATRTVVPALSRVKGRLPEEFLHVAG